MRQRCLFALVLLGACNTLPKEVDPLDQDLPPLPAEGGAALCAAGRLTPTNFDKERVPGPASQGLVGDYFMRNDKVRLVVQQPGRAIGPCPFGGNVIDLDRVDQPAGDQLGELSPFLQLGRTIHFTDGEVVRDGARGGPAVLRFKGHDAKDDFLNFKGLGGFALGIQDDLLADIDLRWRAAVTYVLMPGETRLRVVYTFYNTLSRPQSTLFGTLSDTGAGPEIFHAYGGFGELSFNDILAPAKAPMVTYAALLGRDLAYGIVPVLADKSKGGAAVPVAGVNVEAYELSSQLDAFGLDGQTLKIGPLGTATREVQLLLGRDVADVTAQAHAVREEATLPFAGTVQNGAYARVAVSRVGAADNAALVTTASADRDGRFQGALPPGRYRFQAEAEGWLRSAPVEAQLPAPSLALAVAKPALLAYTVKDRAGKGLPAKIVVVGAPPSTPSRWFRDVTLDALPHGVATYRLSRYGDSARHEPLDRPLPLAPGRYRVVVSRGPEWSRFEQVVDLTAAGARVDAVLDQVAPTPGYVACDFHQHSHLSPDAPATPEERLMGYLVDGADFIASSEHDVVFDYAPLIDRLDARDLLDSSIGIETTAWDYGHFNAFPLTVEATSPNGGAFDWAGGEAGLSLPPPEIWRGLRELGAQVVQVNHPRAMPGAISTFQQAFDRSGLRFDFAQRTFYGDRRLQPVSALILGLPEEASMFAPDFDAVEIYNGHTLPEMILDGERNDQRVELNLRDFMNFLSFGFRPTPTGVSDSHERFSTPSGLPRTLVRVRDDSRAAITAGLESEVIATVRGAGRAKDVVVTNTPFLQLTVDGKGIGETVAHGAGPLRIEARVVTPLWAPVDQIEIFANQTFDIPAPKGMPPQPLVPALCFTARPKPSLRCQMAIGGARPLVVKTVETIPNNGATRRLEMTAQANDVTADQLLARQRPGARGKDLWLLARATGEVGLFPVIPLQVSRTVAPADLVARLDGALLGTGVPALAFTNAIFVDVDGGGWRGPFQP